MLAGTPEPNIKNLLCQSTLPYDLPTAICPLLRLSNPYPALRSGCEAGVQMSTGALSLHGLGAGKSPRDLGTIVGPYGIGQYMVSVNALGHPPEQHVLCSHTYG